VSNHDYIKYSVLCRICTELAYLNMSVTALSRCHVHLLRKLKSRLTEKTLLFFQHPTFWAKNVIRTVLIYPPPIHFWWGKGRDGLNKKWMYEIHILLYYTLNNSILYYETKQILIWCFPSLWMLNLCSITSPTDLEINQSHCPVKP